MVKAKGGKENETISDHYDCIGFSLVSGQC